jgi:hypothetical protein
MRWDEALFCMLPIGMTAFALGYIVWVCEMSCRCIW